MNVSKTVLTMVLALGIALAAGHAEAQRGGGKTPVIIAEVKKQEVVEQMEALGTLRANESVSLATTVSEIVTAIHFEDGQQVKKGDVLLEMDAAEEKAQLAEEQSNVEEAQKQVDRLTPLAKQGAASKSQLDERQRELETARARLAAVQARIDNRRIVAPFDGVVGLRMVSLGALVQPGTDITTLQDNSSMKLDFYVPSLYLPDLFVGMKISARARALNNRVFTGEITAIDNKVDPVTRSVTVRARIPNEDGMLKAGLLMLVDLQKAPRQAIVIPEESVIPEGRKDFVLILDETGDTLTTVRREVELGQKRPGEIEVVSGIEVGEKIVTHGTLRVRPGDPVEIRAVQTGDETIGEMLEQEPPAQQEQQKENAGSDTE